MTTYKPTRNFLLKIVIPIFLISGCEKGPGLGGTCTITGKIIVHDFDAAFQSQPVVYPSVNTSTYIIYGVDHSAYDNSYKTSFDGTYEFKYLEKGKYKIFSYSIDSTGAWTNNPSLRIIPKFIEIEITDNGSTVSAPDLIILNNKQ